MSLTADRFWQLTRKTLESRRFIAFNPLLELGGDGRGDVRGQIAGGRSIVVDADHVIE